MPSHSERVRRNYDRETPPAASTIKEKTSKDTADDRSRKTEESGRSSTRKPGSGHS